LADSKGCGEKHNMIWSDHTSMKRQGALGWSANPLSIDQKQSTGAEEFAPPEREIVKSFGVSRTVVREAVLALANKGLIEARPRFRPVVRKPNYETAFETVDSVVSRLLLQPDRVKNLYDTRVRSKTVRSFIKPMSAFTPCSIGYRKIQFCPQCLRPMSHGYRLNGYRCRAQSSETA